MASLTAKVDGKKIVQTPLTKLVVMDEGREFGSIPVTFTSLEWAVNVSDRAPDDIKRRSAGTEYKSRIKLAV